MYPDLDQCYPSQLLASTTDNIDRGIMLSLHSCTHYKDVVWKSIRTKKIC